MQIRALVVESKDAPFEIQHIELEEPGRGEALVRIVAAGVCQTMARLHSEVASIPILEVYAAKHGRRGFLREISV